MKAYQLRLRHIEPRAVRSPELQELIDDIEALIRAGFVTAAEGADGQLRIALAEDDAEPPGAPRRAAA